MFNNLKNNDLVITNNKQSLLDYLNKHKKLLNLRIMTLKEFKDNYFGYVDQKALYYLISKYKYKYDIAKMYLENYYFLDDLKKELEDHNLINRTPLFKESIKRIVLIDVNVDPYIKKEIDKYDCLILKNEKGILKPRIIELQTIEEEINYTAIQICKLLKTIDIKQIVLVNVDTDYIIPLKRIFKFYNIPININNKINLYGSKAVQDFIHNLKTTKSVSLALKTLEKNDIYNHIVDICNKYAFKEIDDTIIYMISQDIKSITISAVKIDNAVEVSDINQIDDKKKYYFLLGFNQNSCPKIYKDEDFFSDSKKAKLGLFTSMEKNFWEKQLVINKITNFPNFIITYKLKNKNVDYYPSSIIKEEGLHVKSEKIKEYNYSNILNQLELAASLDELIKFNVKNDNLEILYNTYKDIKYLKYDNKYTQISEEVFNDLTKNQLVLSYSSLDYFYHCSFRYYLSNILKLNKYEETFMIYIGNLYHDILSKAFLDKFDFEIEFDNYIKSKEFTAKEKFFVDNLKENLKDVIEIINRQNLNSEFSKEMYEKVVEVDKKNIKFMGIIDKIKYLEKDNKKYMAIIDYKTGTLHVDINNLIYGLSMQLPIYLYLLKKAYNDDIKIAGFYLQKIIHEKISFSLNKNYEKEKEKLYKLEGYSNSDIEILSRFDKTFEDSQFIKSLKLSSKGFYNYSKVIDDEAINKIVDIVDQKIDEAINLIEKREFTINPKKINGINKGCEFCCFKDICYVKEEDLQILPAKDYKDFLKQNNA